MVVIYKIAVTQVIVDKIQWNCTDL